MLFEWSVDGSALRFRPARTKGAADGGKDRDGQELAAQAEAGILPILKAQPGFRSYAVAISADKVFSSSAWDSRAEAESGSAAIGTWVAANMAEQLSLIGDVEYAEVVFSTALGVSTA